ncbi:MAG: peptidoglycan DD-metalloendopeptidase family protein [Candidatus Coatesbacteria bacterium]
MKRYMLLVLVLAAGCRIVQTRPARPLTPAEASFQRGLMCERRSDWAGGFREFDSVRGFDPAFQPGRVLWHLGICQYQLGAFAYSASLLEGAIAIDQFQDTVEPYRMLANAWLNTKNPRKAVASLDRASAVHVNDPWLWEFRMRILITMKKTKEAKEAGLRAEALAFASATPGREKLSMPFEGTWKVVAGNSGGDHWGLASKFAWDFARIDRKGALRDPAGGSARANATYFAWDQPVLAPAEGVIAAAEGAVPENLKAGTPNLEAPNGNYVVIRHPSGEMTMLAHLRAGSLLVKTGDRVARGQPVGRCGNSGDSLAPQVTMISMAQLDPALCRPARLSWYSAPMSGTAIIEGGVPETGEIVRAESIPVAPAPVAPAPVAAPVPVAAAPAPVAAAAAVKPAVAVAPAAPTAAAPAPAAPLPAGAAVAAGVPPDAYQRALAKWAKFKKGPKPAPPAQPAPAPAAPPAAGTAPQPAAGTAPAVAAPTAPAATAAAAPVATAPQPAVVPSAAVAAPTTPAAAPAPVATPAPAATPAAAPAPVATSSPAATPAAAPVATPAPAAVPAAAPAPVATPAPAAVPAAVPAPQPAQGRTEPAVATPRTEPAVATPRTEPAVSSTATESAGAVAAKPGKRKGAGKGKKVGWGSDGQPGGGAEKGATAASSSSVSEDSGKPGTASPEEAATSDTASPGKGKAKGKNK